MQHLINVQDGHMALFFQLSQMAFEVFYFFPKMFKMKSLFSPHHFLFFPTTVKSDY